MSQTFTETDRYFMQRAYELACLAETHNEVPIGSIVVSEGKIVGEGFNNSIGEHDPTAHAELIALRQAAKKIGNYRLVGATLYVTLEPCGMCAHAMIHARIKRLVFGAFDPKTGVAGSLSNTFELPFVNHRVLVQGGLMSDTCGELLKKFFHRKR